MLRFIKKIGFILNLALTSPQLIVYLLTDAKKTIMIDAKKWTDIFGWEKKTNLIALFKLIAGQREFRNLYYFRVKQGNLLGKVILPFFKIFYRENQTLFIDPSTKIEGGLFIQHGFSTIIMAESIGRDCWINQQVTIGYKDAFTGRPKIGNNVQICAGAKVIGEISIGNNIKIGANAVVVKDVPDNCTVVGVPARIVRKDGKRVDEPLI